MADNPHTTNLSRRTALAGGLTGAAGLIAGSAGAALAASHPDAELLDLGRQLAALLAIFDLEGIVCDAANMCGIAATLCAEEFADSTGDEIKDRHRDRVLFAVNPAYDFSGEPESRLSRSFQNYEHRERLTGFTGRDNVSPS